MDYEAFNPALCFAHVSVASSLKDFLATLLQSQGVPINSLFPARESLVIVRHPGRGRENRQPPEIFDSRAFL